MIEPNIPLTQALVKLIAEIDEFKGRWEALKTLSPDRLNALRKMAMVESVGSSTRIEGAKLTDIQVETLLSNIKMQKFDSRDEQEVAGYAEAMDLVFQAFEDMPLTENHIHQLHQVLLRHSTKDERHRGDYKKLSNNVVAIDANGHEIGVIFETAQPFDTPHLMEKLVHWSRKAVDEESMHPLLIVGGVHGAVLSNSPIPRWKWQVITHFDHFDAAQSRIYLCSLCFSGKRDRRE